MFEQHTLLLDQIMTMNNWLESHGQMLVALEKTTPLASFVHVNVVGLGATRDLTASGVEGKLGAHSVVGRVTGSGDPILNGDDTSTGSTKPRFERLRHELQIWRPQPE
jgi:hypothetical protein